MGLRCGAADYPDRSEDRRQNAQGTDAGVEAGLLLHPRSPDWQTSFRRINTFLLLGSSHVDMKTGRPVEAANARDFRYSSKWTDASFRHRRWAATIGTRCRTTRRPASSTSRKFKMARLLFFPVRLFCAPGIRSQQDRLGSSDVGLVGPPRSAGNGGRPRGSRVPGTGYFCVYDADTGKKLKEIEIGNQRDRRPRCLIRLMVSNTWR